MVHNIDNSAMLNAQGCMSANPRAMLVELFLSDNKQKEDKNLLWITATNLL